MINWHLRSLKYCLYRQFDFANYFPKVANIAFIIWSVLGFIGARVANDDVPFFDLCCFDDEIGLTDSFNSDCLYFLRSSRFKDYRRKRLLKFCAFCAQVEGLWMMDYCG